MNPSIAGCKTTNFIVEHDSDMWRLMYITLVFEIFNAPWEPKQKPDLAPRFSV